MAEFFIRHADYIYFLYGLSFLILAGIAFILQKEDPKRLPWFWLGLFGISHGVNEWTHIAEIVFGRSLILETTHVIGLQLSFFFLFEFARESMRILRGKTLPIWSYIPLVLLVASGARNGLEGLNATTCYFFGAAAGLYVAKVFYDASRLGPGETRFSLGMLAALFACYTILNSMFVHHFTLPLDYLTINYNVVVQFWGLPAHIFKNLFGPLQPFSPALGFPVQLLRLVFSAFLVLAVWSYSQAVHRLMLPRGIRSAWLQASAWIMIAMAVLALFGWVFTEHLDAYARKDQAERAEMNMAMLHADLKDELDKIDQAAMAISTSPWVPLALQTLKAEDIDRVNRVLDVYTKIFRMSICYVCDANGVVIASSNRNAPDSLVGNSYAFRPYFKQALSGVVGKYFAVGVTTYERGYYASFPVRNLQGEIIGVAVVKRNAEDLEQGFKHYQYFFLVDENGIIFLSSRPEAILSSLWPIDSMRLGAIRASRQFGDGPFTPLLSKEIVDGEEIKLAGERFYVNRQPAPIAKWILIRFSLARPIAHYRLFGIALTLFFCLFAMIFFVVLQQRESFLEVVSIASNQRKAVLDAATRVAIISTDLTGAVTIFNPGAEKMLGYAASEVIGKKYHEVLHMPAQIEMREKELSREFARPISDFEVFTAYARQGLFEDREWIYVRKDTSRILVKLSVTAQKDAEGTVNGFVIIASDITQEKRAKEDLQESVRFLQKLIDSIPTSIFYKDNGGVYVGCNSAFEDQTGLSRDQIIGKTAYDIFPKELADIYHTADTELFKKKSVQIYETRTFSKRDNSWRDLIVYKAPFFDRFGELGGLIGAELDITERKHAEQTLQKFETRLVRINECISGFGPDYETNVKHVTALCGELLGATCALYNRIEGDMLCSIGQWQTPPDFNPKDKPDGHICYDVIRNGTDKPVVINNLLATSYASTDPNVVKYGLKTYVGQAVRCKTKFVGSLCVVFQEDVNIAEDDKRILSIIANSLAGEEERREVEDALRESEHKFRTIFDNTSDGMFLLDFETEKFYLFNKACLQMLGYTQEEFANLRASDLHPGEDFAFIHEQIERVKRGEKPIGRDARFKRKDGNVFSTDITSDGVMLEGKRYSLVSFRDMTERQRLLEEIQKARSGLEVRVEERTAELAKTNVALQSEIIERTQAEQKLAEIVQELKRSNTELEQFAYISSHDLQEPLRMVTSYMRLLERRYRGKLDKDADHFIAYAVDGAVRMQRLINDLLAYSRVGTRGKEFTEVHCDSILQQVLANLKTSIEENAAAVTHDPLPTVMGDGMQLAQLFQNLIGNAIKFHGKTAPHVHIWATQKDGEWVFAVKDNGIGIEPQYYERIFLIFQRLHTREEYAGTGIGLAICKKIVERHRGRIWVESKHGEGATFYFSIPVKMEERHEGKKS